MGGRANNVLHKLRALLLRNSKASPRPLSQPTSRVKHLSAQFIVFKGFYDSFSGAYYNLKVPHCRCSFIRLKASIRHPTFDRATSRRHGCLSFASRTARGNDQPTNRARTTHLLASTAAEKEKISRTKVCFTLRTLRRPADKPEGRRSSGEKSFEVGVRGRGRLLSPHQRKFHFLLDERMRRRLSLSFFSAY